MNYARTLTRHTTSRPGKRKNAKRTSANELGSYEDFLSTFLDQGYQAGFFDELDYLDNELILRHDVDFDTNFALQTALIESKLGMKATYFFLLRSNFYNIISPQDFDNVCKIRKLGHRITLHFDPMIYEDFHKGLKREVAIFQQYFDEEVEIISLHRPNDFFQKYDAPIMGIEHTYQSKYFHDIKYFSDSTGVWRFGHPFDSLEFLLRKPLHILIHPVWWMVEGGSNFDKLRSYYSQRTETLKTDFINNCKPFQKICENL